MRQDEGRTIGLYFKVSPEEMALIEQKMEQAGTGNKRAYLRKMAVDGYIVHLNLGDLGQLIKLLRSVSNNVNQIARRCNETGNLYGEDVEDLRKGYLEVQMQVVGMVARFPAL
ncbi:MAG: MobC family plasmid mobilization relaxosome protein [Lachnospiraceae bacterium]|nr:MobC family plasmid mobilization relaxosome protein [Lachnospiraceae bacterium]